MADSSRVLTQKIGNTVFYITRFDPFKALEVFADLQRELLPAVGSVLSAALKSDGETGAGAESNGAGAQRTALAAGDEAAIGLALSSLSSRFGSQAMMAWADRLIDPECVSFELEGRAPQKLDKAGRALAFQDYTEILILLWHVIRHNFATPLARWAGLSGPARKLMEKLSDGSGQTSNPS
ncbi:phage tail assembly chaperone [Achromobacter aloeverae]